MSAWATDAIFLYVNAASYEASIYLEEGKSSDEAGEKIHGQFSALPADEFPTMVSSSTLPMCHPTPSGRWTLDMTCTDLRRHRSHSLPERCRRQPGLRPR